MTEAVVKVGERIISHVGGEFQVEDYIMIPDMDLRRGPIIHLNHLLPPDGDGSIELKRLTAGFQEAGSIGIVPDGEEIAFEIAGLGEMIVNHSSKGR